MSHNLLTESEGNTNIEAEEKDYDDVGLKVFEEEECSHHYQ